MNELTPLGQQPDIGLMEENEAPHAPFPVRRLLLFLLKYWWIPVLTLLIGIGAGVGYVLWKPPTFVSQASMWETVKLQLPQGDLFTEDAQAFLGTQTELLKSGVMRGLTLERLNAAGTNSVIPRGTDNQPLPVEISVAGTPSKSSMFVLTAKSSDPAYTQRYLGALMDVFLEYKRNIRKEVSGDTLASITEQVQVTERELKEAQEMFMAFQKTNNAAILEQEGAIAGSYLATLRTKLSDLQLQDRLLKIMALDQNATDAAATNAMTAWAQPNAGMDAASTAGAPSTGQTAFNELEMLKFQRAQLSPSLASNAVEVVELDKKIKQAEKQLDLFRRQSRDQLAGLQTSTSLKIENLQTSIKEWEDNVVMANSRIGEAERLKLNVQRIQNQYDRLVLLVQNVAISRNISQENIAILQPPGPSQRYYLKDLLALALAGIGGLGAGLGIVLLVAVRDDRFTSMTEVNEKLGEVIVGQVPQVGKLRKDSPVPLLESGDDRHAYAESFRSLRSALFYMAAEADRPRVVLITSAMPHEGKSTVAANLARTLALGGSRVVLIDGDLRKGSLHKLMELQAEPGLAELLRQPGDLEKLIQTNSHANLAFISRGGIASNSGDLFLGPAFDQIIAKLRQRFDYVLIDSSPVFAADDASTLAPKVDGTLFVVRSRFSSPKPVREALALLYQRRARVLGVIFNQADPSEHSYYYYKYAEYYTKSGV